LAELNRRSSHVAWSQSGPTAKVPEEAVGIAISQQIRDFFVRQRALGQVSQRKVFTGRIEDLLERSRIIAQTPL
jgi:hypothetical protein